MSDISRYKNWEADSLNQMLNLLVGNHYGNDPVARLDHIMNMKYHEAQNVIRHLGLTQIDRVMDLGSGCGFIAENIAKTVESVYCVDISQTFLDYAKKVNAHHPNVSFCQILYGKFPLDSKFTAIYATSVFIHFNFYDCYWYLSSCFECLEHQGRLLFDILNVTQLDIHSSLWQRHSSNYLENQSNLFQCVYYNHKDSIMHLAKQIGFVIDQQFDENNHSFFILVKP